MASKATAALQRLREIDKKYKYRQEEKFKIDSDSSKELSVVINDNLTQNIHRAQLSIKIPDANEEQLDTNSSNTTNQEIVAIRIMNNVPMSSDSLIKHIINEKSVPVSFEGSSNDIASEVDDDSSINTSKDEPSISENLEESIQSISEKSPSQNDEDLSLNKTVKSIESTSLIEKNMNSKSFSSAKYSEDSFDSSSSAVEGRIESEKFDDASEQTEIRQAVTAEAKIASNNDEKPVVQPLDDVFINLTSNQDDLLKKEEENGEVATSESAQSSKSVHLPTSELTNNLNSMNKTARDVFGNHLSSSQVNLTACNSNSPLSSQKLDKKSKNRETSSASILTSQEDSSSRRHRQHKIKPTRATQTDKRMGKYLKEEIEKESDYLREQKRLHAKMIHYLENLEEDRRTLLLGPSKFIYPEKPKYHHLRPLEFPSIENFSRTDYTKVIQADPCVEILRNRLQDIRQWLKEQYLLYHEHCDLAASINKTYNPITREDTRKLIARLKRRSINGRIQMNKLKINQTI